jgi:hypothetical protein
MNTEGRRQKAEGKSRTAERVVSILIGWIMVIVVAAIFGGFLYFAILSGLAGGG